MDTQDKIQYTPYIDKFKAIMALECDQREELEKEWYKLNSQASSHDYRDFVIWAYDKQIKVCQDNGHPRRYFVGTVADEYCPDCNRWLNID